MPASRVSVASVVAAGIRQNRPAAISSVTPPPDALRPPGDDSRYPELMLVEPARRRCSRMPEVGIEQAVADD